MKELEKEFKYYLDNQDEIVDKFNGKVLVIKDNKVEYDAENLYEAYKWGIDRYKLGTFLIQKCSPGNKDYTSYIYSINL
jgi:hypothetical protein